MKEEILKQRRIYFRMIDEIVEITGYKKQEVHVICKEQVLKNFGASSTTDIDTDIIWKNYIEECKEYWYEKLDIIL